MKHEIIAKPEFAMANVQLEPEESIQVEGGAMVAMSTNVEIETKARGGIFSSAKRAFLGGESFFVNKYTARGAPGFIQLAPGSPGDIEYLPLQGRSLMIQSGSFMACSDSVTIDTQWGGAKAFFGGEGLFMLKAHGQGDIFFASYGAIHAIEVAGSYIVDTGHIVAFEESLTFHVRKVGGLKSLFLSGEGLVCQFEGNGKLYIQTRNPASFVQWIHPFRPARRSN
ncbi:MAG: TIGR00266 family protein [Planctomycetes bacterium]|nr:TIGR00266 family protein [Planctomycetota bacterium]